jgi:Tfp pilus assembly protein FimT
MHTKHGHSLVELLLGITVAGTMTATAIPAVSSMTAHAHANQAAVTVSHDLALAFSNAARERKPIRIAQGAGHQSITFTDRSSGTLLSTRWLGRTDVYALDSVSFSATPVDILPSGVASSPLTVTLWSQGYSRQVTVSLAGWVRVP